MDHVLKILRTLGGETRIKLIKLLQQGEFCVCELEHILELSQPAISQQVRLLKEAGLVESRRDGNWIYYRLQEDNLTESLEKVKRYIMERQGEPAGMGHEWSRMLTVQSLEGDMCPRLPDAEAE